MEPEIVKFSVVATKRFKLIRVPFDGAVDSWTVPSNGNRNCKNERGCSHTIVFVNMSSGPV